jgi:hypothetical protein
MDTNEVDNLLKSDCELSVAFDGVFASDRLPKAGDAKCVMVLNTDPHDEPGEHWVCMYIVNGVGEYFDSYGFPPLIKTFKTFLKENCGNKWTYNNTSFQSLDSDVCGHYCIWFVGERARGKTMDEIKRQFSPTNSKKNDKLVKQWVEKRYGEIAARYSGNGNNGGNGGECGGGGGGVCQNCCARMNCTRFASVCKAHCHS